MHVPQSVNQRALNRYVILLGSITALAVAVAGVIIAGPAPTEQEVDANPFSGASIEIVLDASPALISGDRGYGNSMAVAQAGPRAELDTATAYAPQAPVAAIRSIELLGPEAWDVVSMGNVQQAIALLPPPVQDQLGNPLLGPVRILVNFEGRTSSGFQPYGQAANFFSTNESRNEVILYPQQSVFTIVHELAHAYNLRYSAAGNYATVLIDPEMQSFMAIAGWQVLTPWDQVAAMYDHSQVAVQYTGAPVWSSMSRNDPLEDFANSFALYFVNPGDLASRSPERFAWFAAMFP